MSDPLKPDLGLLCKLGSIAVHVEEAMATGHSFDIDALGSLLSDQEVCTWLVEMDKLALIPKKR
jgi:hypothetical protein